MKLRKKIQEGGEPSPPTTSKAANKREKESIREHHRCTSWLSTKLKFKAGYLCTLQEAHTGEGALSTS
jgi:hypothetical protein